MPDSPKNVDVARLFSSFVSIFKAIPSDKLEDLKDVTDMWNEPGGEHKNPTRAEIVTGPAERMSGGGAEPMIHRYSDFSGQDGLTRLYASFERMLSDFGKSYDHKLSKLAGVVSDIAKGHQGIEAAVKSFMDEIQKAQQPTVAAEPDSDTFFGKAQVKLAKASKAFRKAEMDEDEDDRDTRKARLTEIADMLKSALKLVSKADEEEKHEDEEVEKAVAAIKTLKGRVETAIASIVKAEEAEEEKKKEEEAAEKARQAAATQQAAVTQPAAKSETEEKEEKKDDTAKANNEVATRELVQKAIDGTATLEATVQSLMETVSGMSRNAMPPNFVTMKAAPTVDVEQRVKAAMYDGTLATPDDANAASALLQRSRAADAGRYPRDKLMTDIQSAPSHVRDLFVAQAA